MSEEEGKRFGCRVMARAYENLAGALAMLDALAPRVESHLGPVASSVTMKAIREVRDEFVGGVEGDFANYDCTRFSDLADRVAVAMRRLDKELDEARGGA